MMKRRSSFVFGFVILAAAALAFGQADKAKPRDYTARLVGHAHIDLSWLWRWEETVHDIAVQTFKGTLAQMEKMKGLTFAQSQPALYEAIERDYPELFAAIKAKIKDGTWLPVGGMWVEPDLNMPDGEALARQLLYGKRYFLDKFGVDVKIGWNPDSFGHNFQLPQIYAKAGIRDYVFGRCAPDNMPAFRWRGPDGSEVLCYIPQGWYNVGLNEDLRKIILDAGKVSPLKDFMILYGAGDHGGGPRDSDLEAIRRLRKDRDQPRLEFISPMEYFRMVEERKAELPLISRELNFAFPACYTTQAETKKNNRQMESLLTTAEKFSALAVTSGWRDYYPERDLDEAWKIVLRNQFHDILDGSSIGPVYDEVRRFYQEARGRGQRALDFSLETIGNAIDTRGDGEPLIVYNPLTWERTDVVSLAWSGPAWPAPKIVDARGAVLPLQILAAAEAGSRASARLLFVADHVPALGYKMFRILRPAEAEKPAPPETGLQVSTQGLENEYLKIVLDPKTGWMTSLYDKTAGRELLQAPAVLQAIADEPESMSAWELKLKDTLGTLGESGAKIEVLESGPVRASVRIRFLFRGSSFVQDISLTRGLARVDFRLGLNWQERSVMIKAAFPLAWKPAAADFEIPYGAISRPVDGTEVPALRWVDASDPSGRFGITLLNDGKYGFDMKDNVLRMSVIHGATNPDPEADRGAQELSYALVPHTGTWQSGQALRRGHEFNASLLARLALVHPGSLPAETAFVKAGPENVVLSALKKETGYYERALIVRLYEAFGKKTDARLELPWPVQASETDLIERRLNKPLGEGQTLTIPLEPYEIKTIRLVRK
jgi:alpha-mannosidase